ncbi:ribonuclease HII [candidate division WOR-1 bacterium RIFCSPHIGHO2_02_FULL_45_12]|uniref:Ribonuclease HII n=1 Tax=candidate division WOR-1 bacterium RIFCSPLOWO2_12_FULL_45_9 TaxID=1802568 RepID=A0A1F4RIW0_UNCSA|nr:MAG: ribonuclease HII [candidate division WOR-1 bacterium RIFCSPHIGHO2_02_FULL_45_12]OGC08127.1 MAG: ribonuclease HII [candidate division WOR-1 bacterium RIFCSPLOWO2_12_FULL_45_9]
MFRLVAGVDEAGRGPLAGPIVAAAVILSPEIEIKGLADSKLLSPRRREELFLEIQARAIGVGIGKVNHKLIDKINIGKANLLAMKLAVENLSVAPDYLLIDGRRMALDLDIPSQSIIGGDGKYASIAAASIIAKVTRDWLMLRYHRKYPDYRFDLHKGYGTEFHRCKIVEIGPCPIHRRSFRFSRPGAKKVAQT